MNILFTCAGRRNYLIQYFKEALAGQGKVIACDMQLDAPAMQKADIAIQVPGIVATDYWDAIEQICREHKVDLLFSLNDLELPLLARSVDRFLKLGTRPLVASPEIIDICFDKLATANFLADNGVAGPETFVDLEAALTEINAGRLVFPLIMKPRWGSASIAVEIVESEVEARQVFELIKLRLERSILSQCSQQDIERAVLIQAKLPGQEFHLDIINDLDGNHVVTLAKQKLAMRSGETDKAVSVANPLFLELGQKLGQLTGHPGIMDCDVFLDNDGPKVLELNPRFGGGYPFSQQAGANIPAALVAWAKGETPDPSWLQITPGVTAMKCDQLVIMK